MKVRNINGKNPKTCVCGSWLKHWINFSDKPLRKYCPVKSCLDKELTGTLVQKADFTDTSWYIIPLCTEHSNALGKSLEVFDAVKFVPANIKETCGKTQTRSKGYGLDSIKIN